MDDFVGQVFSSLWEYAHVVRAWRRGKRQKFDAILLAWHLSSTIRGECQA